MSKPATAAAAKPLRLAITNAAENVPRLITAYGKCHGGEAALVLRPHDKMGLLAHVTKAGAHVWEAASAGDVPRKPANVIELDALVAKLRAAKGSTGREGEISVKGQWSGHLHCDDDGKPVVHLTRKVSSYATVQITGQSGAWTYLVTRTARWFGDATEVKGTRYDTLVDAIQGAFTGAIGAVAAACSVRDTTRRAAKDSAYAAKKPIKPAAAAKDKTTRLEAKATKKAAADKKKAAAKAARPPKATKPKAAKPKTAKPKVAAKPAPKAKATKPATPTPKAAKPAAKAKASRGKAGNKDQQMMDLFTQAVRSAMAAAK